MRASEFVPPHEIQYGYIFPEPKMPQEIEHERKNGFIPGKAWLEIFYVLLEKHHGTLVENVNIDNKKIVMSLEETFKISVADLVVGEYYALVPIFIIQDNIIICNAEGDSNSSKSSSFAKYQHTTAGKMFFQCKSGKIVNYSEIADDRPISYSTALVMGSIEKYDELRMLIKLYFSLDMPAMVTT